MVTNTSRACTLVLLAILALHFCVLGEAIPSVSGVPDEALPSVSGVPHDCEHAACISCLATLTILVVCYAETDSAGAIGRSLLGVQCGMQCGNPVVACKCNGGQVGCLECQKRGFNIECH